MPLTDDVAEATDVCLELLVLFLVLSGQDFLCLVLCLEVSRLRDSLNDGSAVFRLNSTSTSISLVVDRDHDRECDLDFGGVGSAESGVVLGLVPIHLRAILRMLRRGVSGQCGLEVQTMAGASLDLKMTADAFSLNRTDLCSGWSVGLRACLRADFGSCLVHGLVLDLGRGPEVSGGSDLEVLDVLCLDLGLCLGLGLGFVARCVVVGGHPALLDHLRGFLVDASTILFRRGGLWFRSASFVEIFLVLLFHRQRQ